MAKHSAKAKKALRELDLDKVMDVYEGKDFVEVTGSRGGDVSRYRVDFDKLGNITGVYER